jgi:acetolactate synthase-1/2/3 large subunit
VDPVPGGRLVAQAPAAHGVDAVFTLCRGHILPVYECRRLEGIRLVDVRHEQAAAHATEAGAGEPAVVNVTLNPEAMAGHPYRGT